MPAKGSAEWTGDMLTGTGTFAVGDSRPRGARPAVRHRVLAAVPDIMLDASLVG